MARPTIYSEELANDICSRIANGESLKGICAHDDMPDKATVYRWLAVDKEFCDKYTRARDIQADYYADELISIADDFEKGIDDPTAVSRAKLQIETRKWIASKLKPKSYGDKITQELTGADGKDLLPPALKIVIGAINEKGDNS